MVGGSVRRHPQSSAVPDHLAVEHRVGDDVLDELGVFVGFAQPPRVGRLCGKGVLAGVVEVLSMGARKTAGAMVNTRICRSARLRDPDRAEFARCIECGTDLLLVSRVGADEPRSRVEIGSCARTVLGLPIEEHDGRPAVDRSSRRGAAGSRCSAGNGGYTSG
jgi:hypothetical protein